MPTDDHLLLALAAEIGLGRGWTSLSGQKERGAGGDVAAPGGTLGAADLERAELLALVQNARRAVP